MTRDVAGRQAGRLGQGGRQVGTGSCRHLSLERQGRGKARSDSRDPALGHP